MLQAILTGDIIGSRDASPEALEAAMATLKKCANDFGHLIEYDLRFTRHRGDGWQILLPRPNEAFEAYLAITAALRAADTGLSSKIAIGIGTVTSPGSRDLSDASGDAFHWSGDFMEHLARSSGSQHVAIAGEGVTDWHQGLLRIADWMVQGWSAQQAKAVALYLLRRDLRTNAHRADALGISRQAYEARFRSSGFPALVDAREAFLHHDFEAAA